MKPQQKPTPSADKASLEASFSRTPNPGFGKADRKDHAYGESYDISLADDPAEKESKKSSTPEQKNKSK